MLFMQTLRMRYCLVIAALLLPFQPFLLIAKKNDSREALLAQIMKHMQGPASTELAKVAIGKIPVFDAKNSIITANERRELQIDALAKKLDKTETSLGSVALTQSLQPIANLELIMQRQAWAKAMLDDTKLYADIRRSLKRIKKSEHAVLAYWDTSQSENGSKLFARAESFYYNWLRLLLGEKINNNKWALETAMALKMLKIGWDVVYYFGGHKLWWDALDAQFSGKELKPWQSIKSGLKAPFMFLSPFPSDVTRRIEQGDLDDKGCHACGHVDRVNAMEIGLGASTLYDTAYYGARGISSKTTIDWGKVGKGAWWLGDKADKVENYVADTFIPQVVKDYTPEAIKNHIGFLRIGQFDEAGKWSSSTNAENLAQLDRFRWGRNWAFGWLLAGTLAYVKGAFFFEGANNTYTSTKMALKTMKDLHVHTIHLARVISTIKEVAQQLMQHPAFKNSDIVAHINKVTMSASGDLKQLFDLLENDTFSTTKAKTHIFSRGNVFLAHRLMKNVHTEIVPLLQSIGELDALYAMVTNMKEATTLPFSFVEFVPASQAVIAIEDGWLPLVRNAVPNTLVLGSEKPNKIIISGPNGGGKSVLLKLIGSIVILAKSWGMVPARRVQMTPIDGLRSCIHPKESLKHELSTFMAEKMRVDDIREFVFAHQHNPHFKSVLLLDEPFNGTVNAEQADRTYEFGKEMAAFPQALVVVAAHLEKPTRLAEDTNGLFANYLVRIKELENGKFEREFKLEEGVPTWWFTDVQKRSRFIDFITAEKHKEQLAQMMALQQSAAAA